MRSHWHDGRRALGGAAFLLAAGLAWAPAMAERGNCASVHVEQPLLLPDGSVHSGGQLTLCVERELSPVASLLLARVDRQVVGLVIARRGRSEGAVAEPVMTFERDAQGRLALSGWARPAGPHGVTYRLGDLGSRRLARAASPTATVLVAATRP